MLSIKMIALANASIPNLLVGTYFQPMPKLRPILYDVRNCPEKRLAAANVVCRPLLEAYRFNSYPHSLKTNTLRSETLKTLIR